MTRRRPRADYRSECFDCGWKSTRETTDAAREHAQRTGHTAACTVERDFIYRGGGPTILDNQQPMF